MKPAALRRKEMVVDIPGPHAEFDVRAVRAALSMCDLADAYRLFSELMAALVDTYAPTTAREVIEACCLMFEEEVAILRTQAEKQRARMVSATLASWTYSALVDLDEVVGDLAGWQRHKLRQLDLEDHDSAAQEPRGGVFLGWYPEEFAQHAVERCEQCRAEFQAALANGDGVKAKFWAERAQHYRRQMQHS